jgi:HK97 family phage prohead protease
MLNKTLSLNNVSIKMDEADEGFVGYASVFGGVDSYGDTIEKGAFKNVLEHGVLPKMFFNHKSWELPVGVWRSMEEDENGLVMRGSFIDGYQASQEMKAVLKAGAIDSLSIGFMMTKDDYEERKDGGRNIKNISELLEVSLVNFPADKAARVDLTSVKTDLDMLTSVRDLEGFLRDAGGFSKSLAQAIIAKSKVLARRDSDTGMSEAKAIQNLIGTLRG